jgi:hypothetical protein
LWAGALSCNKKKISTAERSWTKPLNALQEASHYSFIQFSTVFYEANFLVYIESSNYHIGLGLYQPFNAGIISLRATLPAEIFYWEF